MNLQKMICGINTKLMSKLISLLTKSLIMGLLFVWSGCSDSNDKVVETTQKDDLTIITTRNPKTGSVTLDIFNEKAKRIATHYYGNGFTTCDTNMLYRSKINEFPDEIEIFDDQDSLAAKIECLKVGEGMPGKNGKKFVYDCNKIEYDSTYRVKVGGMDYLPRLTEKAIKRAIHFTLIKDCNGPARIPMLESLYDYEKKQAKRLAYNQNGKLESISLYTIPHEKIYEKKLFVDGEYIKTKCFPNDSLNIEAREFVDEKKSCIE